MTSINLAAPADAVELLALQRLAYESEARLYNDWSIPPLTQTLESLKEEIERITVLKATEGQVIVGSVRASLNDNICLIGRLVVSPSYRRKGIGAALLRAIEHSFHHASRFELFTGSKSESNIRLYSKFGYAITGTKQLSEQVSIVVMSKHANTDA